MTRDLNIRMGGLHEIIDSYGPAIARLAASYEADRALQEDLVQDILFAIHRALPSLRDVQNLGPFIFRIAHNRSASHVMKEMRNKPYLKAEVLDDSEGGDWERDQSTELASDQLRHAVRRLPLPYRQVIVLLLEDLSYAEISEVLQISVSNVGVRVNRAKSQLKAMLDERPIS